MTNQRNLPGVRQVASTATRTRGLFAEWRHQWDSFTSGCNWRDFSLVHVGGEWNHMTGQLEIEVALLGVWLTVTYRWDDTFYNSILADVERMRAEDAPSVDALGEANE